MKLVRGALISGEFELTDRSTGNVIARSATVKCGHCGRNCHPKLHSEPGKNYGHCNHCNRDICANCATKIERGAMCKTWEDNLMALERQLEADLVMRRDYGLG